MGAKLSRPLPSQALAPQGCWCSALSIPNQLESVGRPVETLDFIAHSPLIAPIKREVSLYLAYPAKQ
ncbi:hypothetical protein BKD09_42325 [Bradyrhizobium japonicum]|uniref:Uncharacterized protein n=1 Tax=Bradyrhizobium japonicum TaxID=375 RepID=A0A1L3FNV2_BRAJP|nr:hypothetical protein BKD09_42325 [Bradyrhizobium japonicum]